MSKKKYKTYTVCLKIDLMTDVEISAESLEDALIKARNLKTTDVIEFEGNHNDSEIQVTGVFN